MGYGMGRLRLVVTLIASIVASSAFAQPKSESNAGGVVNATTLAGAKGLQFGVVIEVNVKSMVVACPHPGEPETKPPKEYRLYPVRRLADGKVLDKVAAAESYRWQDVKKGDTISAMTAVDDEDKKRYCLAIRIHRRPGDVCPRGRLLNEMKAGYGADSLLNDIDNGKDVDDTEIKKYFGASTYKNPDSGKVEVVRPGGLPRDFTKPNSMPSGRRRTAEKPRHPRRSNPTPRRAPSGARWRFRATVARAASRPWRAPYPGTSTRGSPAPGGRCGCRTCARPPPPPCRGA